jgi:RNA polymerase sigma-70 factor (ECF subfamily)
MTVPIAGRALEVAESHGDGSDKAVLPRLEAIYREHHGFVWRNARRLGADPAVLDDIVHEVFMVVARRLHEFRGEAQMHTWLFAITYHVIQRLKRDRARYARRLDDYGKTCESQTIGNESGSEEAGYQLRQMLLRLSEPKRLVFIMAELEGMTSAEIGQCLKMNTGTVDSRLRAARQELQRMIERDHARMRRFWP